MDDEPDETLGDSIEDKSETETETETRVRAEKKKELRCLHLECRHKKESFTRKSNLLRHYYSRQFSLPKPIGFIHGPIEGRTQM
jgi:hypothetical protein